MRSALVAIAVFVVVVLVRVFAYETTSTKVGLPFKEAFAERAYFGIVGDIKAFGETLIILDEQGDPALSLLRNGELIQRVGSRGSGPGEFRAPLSIALEKDSLWVYDSGRGATSLYRIRDTLEFVRSIPVPRVHFQERWRGRELIANSLWYPQLVDVYRLGNSRLEQQDSFGTAPIFEQSRWTSSQINRTFMAGSMDGTRFAFGYVYLNRIDFYDSNGARINTFERGPTWPMNYEAPVPQDYRRAFRSTPNTYWAYRDIEAAGQYVLGLFSGRTMAEFPHNYHMGNQIDVLSWDGHLIEHITLSVDVGAIAYDPMKRVLYGVAERPFPVIVAFDLSQELIFPDSL